jgi:transcriptional regulator GlxA family with amidase domain
MLTKGAFTRLCRARDMVRETHERPLSIEDVARERPYPRFHFIRQFHAMFGETPHQLRIRARLDRAKHLPALSDYSVTDVSRPRPPNPAKHCRRILRGGHHNRCDLYSSPVALGISAGR